MLAQDKLIDAETLFEKGEHLLGVLPYEYKIMKGTIKFRLKKRDECMELFKNAYIDVSNSNLSESDKLYLKYYMYSVLIIYKKFLHADLDGVEEVTNSSVSLKEVSSCWKRRFPCRDHPDWDKYGV
ncbi:hypothetical protein [Varunaivibrio sulfuroxidans]|uniref:hypothetical protein n=1 Tax=Varunaivibrio sulfuroxidans TaxID=1773489 RepID=UPI001042DFEF|nr:hypothetical protein [Varunaivibrio sulfuroxidans]WES32017.1 hypothetical protein P3M64_06585 [Varunaivibrio sulfuroxidans]